MVRTHPAEDPARLPPTIIPSARLAQISKFKACFMFLQLKSHSLGQKVGISACLVLGRLSASLSLPCRQQAAGRVEEENSA